MDNLQDLVETARMDLIAALVAGAVSGAAAGALFRSFSLGRFWNAVAGIIGAGAGAQGLQQIGVLQAGSTKMQTLGHHAVSGAIGGALLLILLGLARAVIRR